MLERSAGNTSEKPYRPYMGRKLGVLAAPKGDTAACKSQVRETVLTACDVKSLKPGVVKA
jgi:hypothetical protein